MPRKSDSTKAYCTLREAFDLVGAKVCGPKWRGFEADCDPARAAQPTDTKTLLRKLAPDGQSFSTEEKDRRSVPNRPIDGIHRARFGRAIGRHIMALKEFLRLTYNGHLPTEFILEGEATKREPINPSDWPDPAKFDPKNPSWGNLWFNIAADRVVLRLPKTSPIPGRTHGEDTLWWASGGRAGHVEIDREVLDRALRPPEDKGGGLSSEAQRKGGARPKYHAGLQRFINRLAIKFKDEGKLLTPPTLNAWLVKNAILDEGHEPAPKILDCDDIEFNEQQLILYWGLSQITRTNTL